MDRLVVKAKVSSDGSLHLDLCVGAKQAGQEVLVTVDPVMPKSMSSEQWQEFIQGTAGSITDPEFRRWDQGDLEEREPLK